ncbi:MAG TPA: nitroreductase family protein [Natronosporangium sp.]|nr:nitroreductase family protein [Natronosporangium sp.]
MTTGPGDRTQVAALRTAAQAASQAPSVHNTQPWRWRLGPEQLELFAERERQLKIADPAGRLLTISCGAALHHTLVTLAAAGWVTRVSRLPDDDPDHLATVRLDARGPADPHAQQLAEAIPKRRTDRRSPSAQPVPAQVLAELRADCEAQQIHLHLLPPEQVADLAAAAERANEQSTANPAAHQELRYWIEGPHPPGTGMPPAVLPDQPGHTRVPTREFGLPGTLPLRNGGDRAATYAVFFGEHDTAEAWLRAGEALSATWLAATRHGLALLPFSGVMEVPVTRIFLTKLLSGIGYPYLVARLAYPDPHQPAPPRTPRLAPTETIQEEGG